MVSAATSTVSVTSSPSKVKVYVDSKYYGVTPLNLTGIATGKRVFWLDLYGHPRTVISKNITLGKNTVSATMNMSTKNARVLLLIFNPYLEMYKKNLVSYMNWNNPDTLVQGYINEIKNVSNGYLNYSLAERQVIDGYITSKSNGYRFSDSAYLDCLSTNGQSSPNCALMINYTKLLKDNKVCEKANSGNISEVWVMGGPWMGMYEANMAGPSAWFTNGPIVTGTSCKINLHIMGFSYERGVPEMLEDFGHRTEGTLGHVFGTASNCGYGADCPDTIPWGLFTNFKGTSPTNIQCGNVHHAPNAEVNEDYQWSKTLAVTTKCDDWLNYPVVTGKTTQMSCSSWGCSSLGYMKFWLQHMPRSTGATNRINNNWWSYLA
jgi:hypothetical protein